MFAAIGQAALLVGALLVYKFPSLTKPKTIGLIMAFGAGAIISAVSTDLVAVSYREAGGVPTALGIAIVLDDFGTGYSSMSYLLRFPFDKIKIDRSFVAELTRRDDCAAIVSAVSGLARSLDIATTAEGVETAEQFVQIRAAGYALAQGYLFSRPCPNDQLDFEAAKTIPIQSVA